MPPISYYSVLREKNLAHSQPDIYNVTDDAWRIVVRPAVAAAAVRKSGRASRTWVCALYAHLNSYPTGTDSAASRFTDNSRQVSSGMMLLQTRAEGELSCGDTWRCQEIDLNS